MREIHEYDYDEIIKLPAGPVLDGLVMQAALPDVPLPASFPEYSQCDGLALSALESYQKQQDYLLMRARGSYGVELMPGGIWGIGKTLALAICRAIVLDSYFMRLRAQIGRKEGVTA